MNITASNVLTEDEVFELVNKISSRLSGEERDSFKSLAKSHEALRAGLDRVQRHAGVAYEALGKAVRP